jgi:hypothetical protein
VKFPLTAQLVDEARRFELRSACQHCFHWDASRGECRHGWPDEGQRRWPLDVVDSITGQPPREAAFCKEFELR